jgi:hypothetical protein
MFARAASLCSFTHLILALGWDLFERIRGVLIVFHTRKFAVA